MRDMYALSATRSFSTGDEPPKDMKSAGHAAVPSAVQVATGVHKYTPKRSGMILIAQQHTQNWVDS